MYNQWCNGKLKKCLGSSSLEALGQYLFECKVPNKRGKVKA